VTIDPLFFSQECSDEMTQSCEHHWTWRNATQSRLSYRFVSAWKRSDFYYCTKCLAENEVHKQEQSQDKPSWYEDGK
jgi:Rps23 Pro-64 3,4-dihydroxylase Tpa1-like proline 4-hydroxylase